MIVLIIFLMKSPSTEEQSSNRTNKPTKKRSSYCHYEANLLKPCVNNQLKDSFGLHDLNLFS